ncbi:response regulator transcription factor [Pseudoclavibacter chungangensis]|uniref:Response regulator transcription factor n=1 Tax=Pseudoclavibacter chungangensis TaxID=587635 RepID=A0A7J5BQ95_9MICO|nr:response regulator transcription factor [Pseudoclavibacter chungangensis]KAB1655968.1 response regulator transcription factor [Pseudoclavibacter chungangensis]NYJ66414.1 DNA-binding NarL/FixJ family response regulator [Pseudoclavibacter chungangensis]
MIRVVIVDDQALVRTGLRMLLEHDSDIEVVGEAADGGRGVDLVRSSHPDIVLMDIRMPHLDGIAATSAIVAEEALDDVRVVVLTTFDDDEDVLAAVRAGAVGYLLKDVAPDALRDAVRTVAEGGSLLSPAIAATVMRQLGDRLGASVRPELLEPLTEREREVLAAIARGRSNDEIGRELHLSPATARTYVGRLLTKLGVRDRAQLVVLGYESGLVVPGDRRDGT